MKITGVCVVLLVLLAISGLLTVAMPCQLCGVPCSDPWKDVVNPPKGISKINGVRITSMSGYVFMWVAYGGVSAGEQGSEDRDFYRYDPEADLWEIDWNNSQDEQAPFGSSYGTTTTTAVDPDGTPAVYILSSYHSGLSKFACWTENAGWQLQSVTVPWHEEVKEYFRNGVAMAWDHGHPGCIYVLPGCAYKDSYKDFYRFDIAHSSWEERPDLPAVQGPGNAICFARHNDEDFLYAVIGKYREAQLYRLNLQPQSPSWEGPLDTTPYGADDGSSLAWDGSDYIYHTPGAYREGLEATEERAFERYSLSRNEWTKDFNKVPMNERGGMDDGGGIARIGPYIYVLKGGDDPGGGIVSNEFWCYRIPNFPLVE